MSREYDNVYFMSHLNAKDRGRHQCLEIMPVIRWDSFLKCNEPVITEGIL